MFSALTWYLLMFMYSCDCTEVHHHHQMTRTRFTPAHTQSYTKLVVPIGVIFFHLSPPSILSAGTVRSTPPLRIYPIETYTWQTNPGRFFSYPLTYVHGCLSYKAKQEATSARYTQDTTPKIKHTPVQFTHTTIHFLPLKAEHRTQR
jgi:hypothetical protein